MTGKLAISPVRTSASDGHPLSCAPAASFGTAPPCQRRQIRGRLQPNWSPSGESLLKRIYPSAWVFVGKLYPDRRAN
jgi:hypothetical protein